MVRITLCLLAVVSLAVAQAPAGVPGAGRGGVPQRPSYEVHPDRTVTFELRAPDATVVKISGDFLQGAQDMTKGDDGVWKFTSATLAPAMYSYTFSVNGVRLIDPVNPMLQPGDRSASSMFLVSGEKPAPYEVQSVPHGSVHINTYDSKSVGGPRMAWIYTPPGYESNSARYPVLYLLHGSGDTQNGWVTIGRANLILDNLIAAGKAKPMIVVMPYGRPTADVTLVQNRGGAGQGQGNATAAFQEDLLNDLIPYVEKLYRVSAKADDRALAGLSMGGGQTLQIGLSHLDTFHALGAFSAGGGRGNPTEMYKGFFDDPAAANKKLKLFYIACGKTDSLFAGSQALHDALDQHKIKHSFVASEEGHVWRNWRDYLAEFTPQLFR